MAPPPDSQPSRRRSATKTRLLDSAEVLFAARGFEGTSMRAVTQAAATSVSAAHYHFGSKVALLAAALVRRIEPLNRQRLESLEALERAANGAPVSVEALLDAFLRPTFEALHERGSGKLSYRHIAAQLFADPHEMVATLKLELFAPVFSRYIDAFASALPNRSREELVLNFQFVVGVMVHVISGHTSPNVDADSPKRPDEGVLRQMVAFAAAGLRAQQGATNLKRPAGATP